MKKVSDDEYVVVLNFPFKTKIVYDSDDGFCKYFRFEKCLQRESMLASNIDYTGDNIKEVVNPFSVIEWHCNIKEYSYANHDDHPHLHKHDELLHVSFVDNNIDNQIITIYCNLIAFITDIKSFIIIPYTKYFIMKRYIFSW